MRKIAQWLNSLSKLEKGVLFCFIIPPLGMAWLFALGISQYIQHYQQQKIKIKSSSTALFLLLISCSIGAAFTLKSGSILLISLMLLSYWGLYLHLAQCSFRVTFGTLKWVYVGGAIYSCVVGKIAVLLPFPKWLGLISGTYLFGKESFKNYDRISGVAYNPNFNMFLLLIGLALLFVELQRSIVQKKYRFAGLYIVFASLLTSGVVATESRAGFAAMILLYLLFFFRISRTLFIVIGSLGLFVSPWLINLMPRGEIVSNSIDVRETIWQNAFQIWKDNWLFGTTSLGFKDEYIARTGELVPHAHNMVFGIFTEYGLFGGVAISVVALLSILKVIIMFFYYGRKHTNHYFEYFLYLFPVFILTGFVDYPTFSPQIGLLTIIAASLWFKYSRRVYIMPELVATINQKVVRPTITAIRYFNTKKS
ncbi:MAG: O-antigen ligase family protein [Bacilli bacterium]